MPPELGLFMDKTWRLHPDICDYTSEVFYEGALLPEAGNERQALSGSGLANGQGIRFIAVDHGDARNDNRSVEEARVIADLVADLLDGRATWVDRDLAEAPMTPADILVITPYNAQRKLIGAQLAARGAACAEVQVGTVDKFQGQQAPVSIYSMATSRPEDAPRGMEFLYSLNRLNVATSRARCLTLVVASPELIQCPGPLAPPDDAGQRALPFERSGGRSRLRDGVAGVAMSSANGRADASSGQALCAADFGSRRIRIPIRMAGCTEESSDGDHAIAGHPT